jgi:hypothetical protein
VTTALATARGIVKQVVEESVDKMQTQITFETIDTILQKEIEVKEKATIAKDTLEIFMENGKKA